MSVIRRISSCAGIGAGSRGDHHGHRRDELVEHGPCVRVAPLHVVDDERRARGRGSACRRPPGAHPRGERRRPRVTCRVRSDLEHLYRGPRRTGAPASSTAGVEHGRLADARLADDHTRAAPGDRIGEATDLDIVSERAPEESVDGGHRRNLPTAEGRLGPGGARAKAAFGARVASPEDVTGWGSPARRCARRLAARARPGGRVASRGRRPGRRTTRRRSVPRARPTDRCAPGRTVRRVWTPAVDADRVRRNSGTVQAARVPSTRRAWEGGAASRRRSVRTPGRAAGPESRAR